MTVRPPRSMVSVAGPRSFSMSALRPVAMIRCPRMARASAVVNRSSTVRILPLSKTLSAPWARTAVDHAAARAKPSAKTARPDMPSSPCALLEALIGRARSWLTSLATFGENAMPPSSRLSTLLGLAASGAYAQEDFATWPLLQRTSPSTGGGGIMIGDYDPVIIGDKCITDFTATEPGRKVYYNTVEFEAVPAQGGILCTDGKWRARDGSASGTTPYRVFIKDGVPRGSP